MVLWSGRSYGSSCFPSCSSRFWNFVFLVDHNTHTHTTSTSSCLQAVVCTGCTIYTYTCKFRCPSPRELSPFGPWLPSALASTPDSAYRCVPSEGWCSAPPAEDAGRRHCPNEPVRTARASPRPRARLLSRSAQLAANSMCHARSHRV